MLKAECSSLISERQMIDKRIVCFLIPLFEKEEDMDFHYLLHTNAFGKISSFTAHRHTFVTCSPLRFRLSVSRKLHGRFDR